MPIIGTAAGAIAGGFMEALIGGATGAAAGKQVGKAFDHAQKAFHCNKYDKDFAG